MKARIAPPGARWKRRGIRKNRTARVFIDWTLALVFAIFIVLTHLVLR